jgi:protoheme IX farnesyltransferase
MVDYIALTKPELTFLAVVTAMAGFYLGTVGSIPFVLMLHALVGTALVGAGAGALNQYIEREHDAMMRRTENRPLPSGRLSPREVLLFGMVLSLLGIGELLVFTNLLTGFLAIVTFTTYLFLYTPLKRITPVATLVGAVPGALPPVMGWAAARNEITLDACILFAILFLWQMPHFLSLAWMYRKDYARAGFRILTVFDKDGSTTRKHILIYTIALVPITVVPVFLGSFGIIYLIGAAILGLGFLCLSLQLISGVSTKAARRVFFASLLYLPALLLMMIADRV